MSGISWGGRLRQAGSDERVIESAFLDGLGMFVRRTSPAASTIEGAQNIEGGTGPTLSLFIALSNRTRANCARAPSNLEHWGFPALVALGVLKFAECTWARK